MSNTRQSWQQGQEQWRRQPESEGDQKITVGKRGRDYGIFFTLYIAGVFELSTAW